MKRSARYFQRSRRCAMFAVAYFFCGILSVCSAFNSYSVNSGIYAASCVAAAVFGVLFVCMSSDCSNWLRQAIQEDLEEKRRSVRPRSMGF